MNFKVKSQIKMLMNAPREIEPRKIPKEKREANNYQEIVYSDFFISKKLFDVYYTIFKFYLNEIMRARAGLFGCYIFDLAAQIILYRNFSIEGRRLLEQQVV